MDVASLQFISAEPAKGEIYKPRQFIFRMKLIDAADIVESLMANEDYGVSNHLKSHKVRKCSGTDDMLENRKVPTGMTAVAVFRCNRHGKSAEEKRAMRKAKGLPIHRIRDSKGTSCRAEIRIKFGDFYHTKNGCVLNVDDFGDCEVEVAWKRDHNHKEPEIDKNTKMQMDEYVRKQVKAGVTWPQFSATRKKLLLCTEEDQIPPALLRIDYQHWFNESRRQIGSQAVEDEDCEKSMRKWVDETMKEKKMAAFTDRL